MDDHGLVTNSAQRVFPASPWALACLILLTMIPSVSLGLEYNTGFDATEKVFLFQHLGVADGGGTYHVGGRQSGLDQELHFVMH